jgi:hypothetical protein
LIKFNVNTQPTAKEVNRSGHFDSLHRQSVAYDGASTACFTSYFSRGRSNPIHSSHKSLLIDSVASKKVGSVHESDERAPHLHTRNATICTSFSEYFKAKTRLSAGNVGGLGAKCRSGTRKQVTEPSQPVIESCEREKVAPFEPIQKLMKKERRSLVGKTREIASLRDENVKLRHHLMTLQKICEEQERQSRSLLEKKGQTRRLMTETEGDIVVLQGKVKQLQKVFKYQQNAIESEKQKYINKLSQLQFWNHLTRNENRIERGKAKTELEQLSREIHEKEIELKKLRSKKNDLEKTKGKLEKVVTAKQKQLSNVATVFINLINNIH